MTVDKIYFHPHEVGCIMTDAQSIDKSLLDDELLKLYKKPKKTEEEKALLEPYWTMSLSAGAKTFCKNLAKQYVYGFKKELDNKYLEKGLMLEDAAIEFLGNRRFRKYVKNTERRYSEYLSGECDIYDELENETLDTKVSWSLDTFPVFVEDAHDSTYEWQGRSYLKLWNAKRHTVVFVLMDTPESILPRWEQIDLHQVSHLNPALRMTSITYARDLALEAKLDLKCKVAHKYMMDCISRIKQEHGMRVD